MQASLLVTKHPSEASRGDAKAAAEREPDGLDRMMMDTLRQRIAPRETKREAVRERSRLVEQRCGTSRKACDCLAQLRRRHAIGERFDAYSVRGQGLDW